MCSWFHSKNIHHLHSITDQRKKNFLNHKTLSEIVWGLRMPQQGKFAMFERLLRYRFSYFRYIFCRWEVFLLLQLLWYPFWYFLFMEIRDPNNVENIFTSLARTIWVELPPLRCWRGSSLALSPAKYIICITYFMIISCKICHDYLWYISWLSSTKHVMIFSC